MSSDKIGPLDKDTALVLLIAGGSSGIIIVLSAFIMLMNSWTGMAAPDRASDEFVPSHGGHGDDHGGDHGDEHGDDHGDDHGDEHADEEHGGGH
jgi:hypothetical protein